MTVPLQVTFKDMEASAALEARIREKAAQLERFERDILRCQVTVEEPHRHHRQGRLYQIRIRVAVPRDEIVVTRETHAHEDAYVAVRDAFEAVVRQLEDHARRARGQVKHHESPLQSGRVVRIMGDHGFIETGERQEVYFHRNSVAEGGFDRLAVGDAVRLGVVEGDKGWQASTVQPAGTHHSA